MVARSCICAGQQPCNQEWLTPTARQRAWVRGKSWVEVGLICKGGQIAYCLAGVVLWHVSLHNSVRKVAHGRLLTKKERTLVWRAKWNHYPLSVNQKPSAFSCQYSDMESNRVATLLGQAGYASTSSRARETLSRHCHQLRFLKLENSDSLSQKSSKLSVCDIAVCQPG